MVNELIRLAFVASWTLYYVSQGWYWRESFSLAQEMEQ